MNKKIEIILDFFKFTLGIPILAIVVYKVFPNLITFFPGIKIFTITGFFCFLYFSLYKKNRKKH